MNYTVEQKKFNNSLTEQLLEVARKHNYEFDKNDFNFVAIRDRIRCYYKSYVQNCKKRGITVGYDSNGNKRQRTDSVCASTCDLSMSKSYRTDDGMSDVENEHGHDDGDDDDDSEDRMIASTKTEGLETLTTRTTTTDDNDESIIFVSR